MSVSCVWVSPRPWRNQLPANRDSPRCAFRRDALVASVVWRDPLVGSAKQPWMIHPASSGVTSTPLRPLEGPACQVRRETLDGLFWVRRARQACPSSGTTSVPLRLLAEPSRTDALVASIELNIPVRDLADCLKGLMNLIQRPQTYFRSYPRAKGIEALRFSKHDIRVTNEAFGWERTIRDH